MGLEALKTELIEWLKNIENAVTIQHLAIVKGLSEKEDDWWDTLSPEQQEGLLRGKQQLDEGKRVPFDEVKKRHGL